MSFVLIFSTIEKIVEIDTHLACAFSGLTADSKMLIERARVEAQNHWFNHDRQMPVESIGIQFLDHGLRMPNEAFFVEIQNFWAWADKLGT